MLSQTYCLCKFHKSLTDNCPRLRPILSAIETPSDNIAKHLVRILETTATNKFTIKNSFEFAKEAIRFEIIHGQFRCRVPFH